MSVEEIHLNEIGTIFEVTLKDDDLILDVSTATNAGDKQLVFKKPSGIVITQEAVFKTDGSDGIIQYVSIDGDLDELLVWQIQAKVTIPGLGTWSSDISKFKVYENL